MKHIFKIFTLATLVIALGACSTKKNNATSRAFHKFTGHYNPYFNGYESYKEGKKKADNTYPISFDELLPVFSFAAEDVPNQITTEMERAITKSQKVIEKHSISAKPELTRGRKMNKEERAFYNKKEFNEKIPIAYMLVAKAQIYTQDYLNASLTLEFMESQFAKDTILYESRIWRAVVATERGELEDALSKLKAISRIKNYPKPYHQLYHLAWANLYIKEAKYQEAAERLQKALKTTSKQADKIRYNFLLAQLYQKLGDNEKALKIFAKVSKMNAPYSVRFAAQLSKAASFDPIKDIEPLRSLYKKMLKDRKNSEFKDQIYYALGNLELLNKNITQAIEYYQKSIDVGISNPTQIALAHIALANFYFDAPDFIKAFEHYKQAENTLPPKHNSFTEIQTKVAKLAGVAENLEIVVIEDSLRNLAQMPEIQRNLIIDNLIAQAKQHKEQEKSISDNNSMFMSSDSDMFGSGSKRGSSGGDGSKWYFYNTIQLSAGLNDFNMRWGKRRLEDNWRRQNKNESVVMEYSETSDEILADTDNAALDSKADSGTDENSGPETREYYLQNIPLTPQQKQLSDNKLMNALYLVATAYKNDLDDKKRAIESYERLVDEFPESEYNVASYYYLYSLCKDSGDYSTAEKYKNKLATLYPQHSFTLAITNPEYLQQQKQKEEKIEKLYNDALAMYRENNNAEALSLIDAAINEMPESEDISRLEMLKVLATNYEDNIDGYKQSLNNIVSKYKNEEIGQIATDILKTLDENRDRLAILNTEKIETIRDESLEFRPYYLDQYILVLIDNSVDAHKLSFEITLFNADNYLNEDFDVAVEQLGNEHRVIIIKTLVNRKAALDYYHSLIKNSTLQSKFTDSDAQCVIISPDNFRKLKQNKDINSYLQFFKDHY